ncbi:AfsR/SARP family transcriptional regulator [Kribbella ginsengisoli]|uniref:OmpR/PhoB-type domain-containing protein n=1 Tax=Kribbella ginsengisoli TaxID=363865 RepID=A0ABP6Z5G8_9ACTN
MSVELQEVPRSLHEDAAAAVDLRHRTTAAGDHRSMAGHSPSYHGVQVRLLGAVDLRVGDEVIDVSGVRRKALLAALALGEDQPVSRDLLIDVVWSGSVPATVTNTLQSHVSYLRRRLGTPKAIAATTRGYRLSLGPSGTDAQVAERLVSEAGATADLRDRATKLRSALALWRGMPMVDIRGHLWIDDQAERLGNLRWMAVKALIDTRLRLGQHAQLVPALEELVPEHPFDEDLGGQLMLALYRSGRQADALSAFRRIRERLGDELGIDPGRALRDLEQAILRQDVSLDVLENSSAAAVRAEPLKLLQLPPVSNEVVGRDCELARLDHVLSEARSVSMTMPTVAITGMPGIGKTNLALWWAHVSAAQFPDGQLYAGLHGFESTLDPTAPLDVLIGFLTALGVPADRIPADLDAAVGLYRSHVAGMRLLVVLDGAADAEQVRPLLPSTPGCMAVITSRADLAPLTITNGASQLRLRPLSAGDSLLLVAARLGQTPENAELLLERCAGLPLALAIAASRWRDHFAQEWAAIAANPPAEANVLTMLASDDPATDLRRLFAGSYRHLSEDAADLFRSISTVGIDHRGAGGARFAKLIRELERNSLVERQEDGTFSIHPLLRSFGAELELEARSFHRHLT